MFPSRDRLFPHTRCLNIMGMPLVESSSKISRKFHSSMLSVTTVHRTIFKFFHHLPIRLSVQRIRTLEKLPEDCFFHESKTSSGHCFHLRVSGKMTISCKCSSTMKKPFRNFFARVNLRRSASLLTHFPDAIDSRWLDVSHKQTLCIPVLRLLVNKV